jgi:hypothetical protein
VYKHKSDAEEAIKEMDGRWIIFSVQFNSSINFKFMFQIELFVAHELEWTGLARECAIATESIPTWDVISAASAATFRGIVEMEVVAEAIDHLVTTMTTDDEEGKPTQSLHSHFCSTKTKSIPIFHPTSEMLFLLKINNTLLNDRMSCQSVCCSYGSPARLSIRLACLVV